MFLDDTMLPSEEYDIIVRSFEEAINWIQENGIPNFISFDFHLTNTHENIPTGFDFAKWLIQQDKNGNHKFPDDFDFKTHGDFFHGNIYIKSALNNYLHFGIEVV